MKTTCLILLFLWVTIAVCVGQSKDELTNVNKTFIGLSISGNHSWVDYSDSQNIPLLGNSKPHSGIGYKVGLNLYRELSKDFFIECAPSYVFQQYRASLEGILDSAYFVNPNPPSGYTSDSRTSISWIELPVSIVYSYPLNQKVSLTGGIGMSVRKLLNSEIESTITLSNGFTLMGTFDARINEWAWFPSVSLGAVVRTSEISRLTFRTYYERNVSKLYRSPEPLPPNFDYQFADMDVFLNSISLCVVYSVDIRSLK